MRKTYVESIRARVAMVALHRRDGPRKELPRSRLDLEHLGRRYLAQHVSERGAVGAQEEELLPEALGPLVIFLFVLVQRRRGARSAGATSWCSGVKSVESKRREGDVDADGGRASSRGVANLEAAGVARSGQGVCLRRGGAGRGANLEERVVEVDDLGGEGLWLRKPGQR